MALLDKLNTLAATATSKANNAIENGKLNLKINSEERKIAEFTLNIGELLVRKNYYFVPFGQDNAIQKPCSLVADFSKITETVDAALRGEQIQPLLLR